MLSKTPFTAPDTSSSRELSEAYNQQTCSIRDSGYCCSIEFAVP